jgi:hypothetical protein
MRGITVGTGSERLAVTQRPIAEGIGVDRALAASRATRELCSQSAAIRRVDARIASSSPFGKLVRISLSGAGGASCRLPSRHRASRPRPIRYNPCVMTSAEIGFDVRQSLALPPHARRSRSVARPLLAIICVLNGLMHMRGVTLPLLGVVEGAFWIALGIGVWRKHPSTVRWCIALVLAALTVTSLSRLATTPALWPWEVCFAVVYLALGVGLWSAREWARRAAIFVGLALTLYEIAGSGLVLLASNPVSVSWMGIASVFILALGLVIYGVSQETREHFAAVHTARIQASS